jgi:hypothetical protein
LDFSTPVQAGSRWFEIDGDPITKMAGSHNWANVVGIGGYTAPLGIGNFVRLWATVESSVVDARDTSVRWNTGKAMRVSPMPWSRRKGKFDLTTHNPEYLDRVVSVVKRARRRGKVVAVVLFEGPLSLSGPLGWQNHAFNPANNLQKAGPPSESLVHTNGKWFKYQRLHAKRLIQATERFNNVVYEIANEPQGRSASIPWTLKMEKYVDSITKRPVGVSHIPHVSGTWAINSDADWISIATSPSVRPAFRGPVVWDSDHNGPLRSQPVSFATAHKSGMIPILMDGLGGQVLKNASDMSRDRDVITGIVM